MQCRSITPFGALRGSSPRAANLAHAAGAKFSRAGQAGSLPTRAWLLRNSGLATFWRLLPRPHEPCTHSRAARKSGCSSHRAWHAGSCCVISPEPTGKCLPCKGMPFRNNLNSPAKEQILPSYRSCSSPLTAPNLGAAAPNLTPAPTLLSHSSPRLTRAGELALARHARLPGALRACPASTAPRAPAVAAGRRGPVGAIFLACRRAPGCAVLTCVFFIRKGSAVIQPRQRCGNSV